MRFHTPFLPIPNHHPNVEPNTRAFSISIASRQRGVCVAGCGDETEMARVVCGLWDQAFTGTVHSLQPDSTVPVLLLLLLFGRVLKNLCESVVVVLLACFSVPSLGLIQFYFMRTFICGMYPNYWDSHSMMKKKKKNGGRKIGDATLEILSLVLSRSLFPHTHPPCTPMFVLESKSYGCRTVRMLHSLGEGRRAGGGGGLGCDATLLDLRSFSSLGESQSYHSHVFHSSLFLTHI